MLQDRKTEGEFHTLYPRLIDDESKFHSYFRMNKGTFEKILSKIEDDLKKGNTPFREALTPREKLAVCLSCHMPLFGTKFYETAALAGAGPWQLSSHWRSRFGHGPVSLQ
ncbi:uncharacterized protein LOC143033798 [Oratosquilla oratoria]